MSDYAVFVVVWIAFFTTMAFSMCTPPDPTPLERVRAYQACIEIENANEQTCKDIAGIKQ